MATRATPRGWAKARSESEVRRLFRDAFVHALNKSAASTNAAARWLRRRPSTVRQWVNGTHRIDLEAVARSAQLWPHFLRCLLVLERKARRV